MRISKRRRLLILPTLALLVGASVVAAPAASAKDCFASGSTATISNIKFTASSTYTLYQYNVASSGATSEKVVSTVARNLGSLTLRFGSCKTSTGAYTTTASLPVSGVNTTDVDTILSGSYTSPTPTVSWKPTNGTKGWTIVPGVSAEGSGYYTISMAGLVCTTGSSSLPPIVGLLGAFVPIPGGVIVSGAISTAGSWLIDYWSMKTTYAGCTQPTTSSSGVQLAQWKTTRGSTGLLTLPSSTSRTIAYSKYVSNSTYCTATSNIDCGLHYQTYITITASKA
jgi:hypothetical protein